MATKRDKHPHLKTYPDGTPFTGRVGPTLEASEAAWPVKENAPADAPNVLFIVLDDLGYAQLGCYGGLGDRIRTPHIDALAARGLRYRDFHTTALCSPTRGALLTGRNQHSLGLGIIVERATGFPGYNARVPKDCAMLPRVLGANGYGSYCVGKWHLTPDEHNGPTGPFDRWPLGQGFDRFYGFLPGETDQWHPDLWEDNHRTDPPPSPEYHLSEDLADRAIQWLTEHWAVDEDRPFFMHFATGAPHAPHHAPRACIEAYRGVFDDGWDVIRAQTFERQLALGVVPPGTELPARNRGVPAWDSLGEQERELFCRQMEVYAAFVTHTDAQVGRLIAHLEESGQFENTLIFLLSDNGASAEGGRNGLLTEISYFNGLQDSIAEMHKRLDEWGGPSTYPHYAAGWAWLGNTPQRWYKAFVHEGGTRDPLIVSWPARIRDPGAVRGQFHHVVDIAQTVFQVTGIDPPPTVDGVPQRPHEGTPLDYTFDDGGAPTRKRRQYFEMFAHRAIWADGWKAVTLHPSAGALRRIGDASMTAVSGRFDEDVWELYHLDEDFAEARDLAGRHPGKLAELQRLWHEDAERFQVFPLDDRMTERMSMPRPRVVKRKAVHVWRSPMRLVRSVSPSVVDRAHRFVARIDGGQAPRGVIVSNGGLNGGYSLFVHEARLHYVSNFLGKEHFVLRADQALPKGEVVVELDWLRSARFAGQAVLRQNGVEVGRLEIPRTNPVFYAVNEGLEIGSDSGVAVWPGYDAPFVFSGRIIEVSLDLRGPEHVDAAAEARAANYRQ
ncbi:MAG: arylsulfatase [Burkholderiaceae bacterium]